MEPVIFTDVLHVPTLSNNLLSILTLTTCHGLVVVLKGRKVFFNDANCTLLFTATVDSTTTAYLDGTTVCVPQPECSALKAMVVDKSLIHRRMCHLGHDHIDQLVHEDLMEDLTLTSTSPMAELCEPCISGKQHHAPFPKTAERATGLLDHIFSNVHGPMPVAGHGTGRKYWVTFIDDHSHWLEVYDMLKKSDVFASFKLFKSLVERQTGRKIRCFHNDKGGEYKLGALLKFCADEGIRVEFTTRATPQQNGVAERSNRTMSEAITSMITEANLPPSFWNHALSTYHHVHNRCLTSALGKDITPYEVFKGRKPKIGHLRVFGCRAYVLIGRDKRKSLQGHTMKGVFIGYPDNYAGWKVYIPSTKKTVVSQDVIFDEFSFPGLSEKGIASSDIPHPAQFPELGDIEPYDSDEPFLALPFLPPVPPPELVGAIPPHMAPSVPALAFEPPPAPPAVVIPPSRECHPRQAHGMAYNPNAVYYDAIQCQIAKKSPLNPPAPPPVAPPPDPLPPVNQPMWNIGVSDIDANGEQEVAFQLNTASAEALMLAAHVYVAAGLDFGGFGAMCAGAAGQQAQHAFKVGAHDTNPRNFTEAMSSENAAQWWEAMCEEMNALQGNGTWRVVYLSAGKKAIGSRWVFKVKHLPDGTVECFKACVVAQGFSQHPGVDFDETFAPTARWNAVCTILALAAIDDMHLKSVDISSAFLNGVVDAELYLHFPEGFPPEIPAGLVKLPGDGEPVGLLDKGLYGLKQGAYLWHKEMHRVFLLLGFTRIDSDPCVYVYIRDDVRVIIPVHVDDMTIVSKSHPSILHVISELKKHFKLRHLGPTTGLLGVRVTRDRPARKLWIDQRAYAIDVLSRFSMLNSKAVTTPMDPNIRLSKSQSPQSPEEEEEMRNIPYIQATGALLYLALCTRPDIAYSVGVLG